MTVNKLVLDDFLEEEDFSLIAIHCSAEIYKIAYYLNRYLNISLRKEPKDLDFSYLEGLAYYELYKHYNQKEGNNYYLVSNKCKIKVKNLQSNGYLFNNESEKTVHLLPSYTNADCFLKIEEINCQANTKKILTNINQIQHIVSAYQIEPNTLKSKENLIFN